jgi:integrase/recombinase XerD
MTSPTPLATALRAFFAEHLVVTRGLSPRTLTSYRDAFVLLLRFLSTRHHCEIVALDLPHVDVADVLAFLDDLETTRHNSVATRNARLAAIHTFVRFVATRSPGDIERCQRILAVPSKRGRTRAVDYLESDEVHAMLEAAAASGRTGTRDYALVLTLFNTGARVQELLDARPADLCLQPPTHIRFRGKGQKERLCPLWPETASALRRLVEQSTAASDLAGHVFHNQRGRPLTRFGVRYILRQYARRVRTSVPTLTTKRIHPHTYRHSAAVHLLRAGVDLVTISHWLGHASIETTNRYVAIDLETKRQALLRAGALTAESERVLASWRKDASVLTWLEAL